MKRKRITRATESILAQNPCLHRLLAHGVRQATTSEGALYVHPAQRPLSWCRPKQRDAAERVVTTHLHRSLVCVPTVLQWTIIDEVHG
jgi:hypothetical protein